MRALRVQHWAGMCLRALLLLLVLTLLPAARSAVGQDQTPTKVFLPVARYVTPVTQQPPGRAAALQLYQTLFLPHITTPHAWTGNLAACNPGTLSPTFTESLLKLVNYYRTAAGLPTVTFNTTYSARAQAAALIMTVNERMSHWIDSSWECYSDDGATGAIRSNLSLWLWYGVDNDTARNDAGIRGQMEDFGPDNTVVGHRRWILDPYQQEMGVGNVPHAERGNETTYGGGALYVVGDAFSEWPGPARQTPRDGFIAWPPQGYVPWQALYGRLGQWYINGGVAERLRWSFQIKDAEFGGATVTMTHNGAPIQVTRLADVNPEDDENVAVWVPALDYATLTDGADHAVQVTVANVGLGGQTHSFSYTVVIFDGRW